MRQESNQHGPMTNGNPGHSVNGSLVGNVPPPNVPGTLLLTESLQPMDDIRVHTPHPMAFNEMY